jgi:two-component sensor histidine kinase
MRTACAKSFVGIDIFAKLVIVSGAGPVVQRVIPYLPRGARPFWRGQAVALASVAVAVACRAAVDPFVHQGLYFTLLFPAVLVAGLFGGVWSGVTAAAVGGLVSGYVFVPPVYSLNLVGDGWFRLLAFWTSSGLVILLTAFIHAVLDRLAAAEDEAETIAAEMRHRVRNTLTLVQAVAHQTFRTAVSLQDAREILMERLAALGRAQTLIGEGFERDVSVQTLIGMATDPFDAHQFAMEGPPLTLPRDAAVSFALLIHELATNAAKHGALSSPKGKVEISWLEQSAERGCLIWKERFGPEVVKPSRSGFGSKLLQTAFPQGKGDAAVEYESDGVRCRISFPIVRTVA